MLSLRMKLTLNSQGMRVTMAVSILMFRGMPGERRPSLTHMRRLHKEITRDELYKYRSAWKTDSQ